MNRKLCVLSIVIMAHLLLPVSQGIIGYDIVAKVDSTRWEIHRSTQATYFYLNGSSDGIGSFSKNANIQNFAGMKSAESSYALSGETHYHERYLLRAAEGPVQVKTDFIDLVIDEENATGQLNLSEGRIEIEEKWPTYIADYKKISYQGPGIRTREKFNNNGDIVSTSINSRKLSKENIYRAYLNKTIIYVDIKPPRVVETRFANRSSSYLLDLKTVGSFTRLDLARHKFFTANEPFGRPVADSQISQEYQGSQNMTLLVKMDDYILPGDPGETPFLDCCSGGYFDMVEGERRYLSAEGIFDCSCSDYVRRQDGLRVVG